MAKDREIQPYCQKALDGANSIFKRNNFNFRTQVLTVEDMEWCVALQRQQPESHRLRWDLNGGVFSDPDAFTFSFKIFGTGRQPAGACTCLYCPATYSNPAMLNIEMIQNFHIQNSILDGNTVHFTLYVLVLFMKETQCGGLRLISPSNDYVASYYIDKHGFIDIGGGDKALLFRDAVNLVKWFDRTTALTGPEQLLIRKKKVKDNRGSYMVNKRTEAVTSRTKPYAIKLRQITAEGAVTERVITMDELDRLTPHCEPMTASWDEVMAILDADAKNFKTQNSLAHETSGSVKVRADSLR